MPKAEWSLHRHPDLIIEIWSTAALLEAVLKAVLEQPGNLRRALETLRSSQTR